MKNRIKIMRLRQFSFSLHCKPATRCYGEEMQLYYQQLKQCKNLDPNNTIGGKLTEIQRMFNILAYSALGNRIKITYYILADNLEKGI